MALPNWTKLNGEIANIEERVNITFPLPLGETDGITVSVISGEIPPGLRIENYNFVGTPFEVGKTTEFEFVLRASNSEGISDRTFTITVRGADEPVWQTNEGPLPLKRSFRNQYWVDTLNTNWGIFESVDSTYVDQTVTLYENIPSRATGDNGDWAFVSSIEQFWHKVGGRWYRANITQLQGVYGNAYTFKVSDTVPNPNIDQLWLNTNAINNGLKIALRRWNDDTQVWQSVSYTVSKTAPISPFRRCGRPTRCS